MREIIDRILEGNFDYDKGSLDFSCSKLEIHLLEGEDAEGSFQVFGEEGRALEGEVLSSDLRMECLTPHFVGNGEEIHYFFHAGEMQEGDVAKGIFAVISNQGEYYLPFVVSIDYSRVESSMGNIKNLFHFANLAKANPEEALGLFYSPEFRRVFGGSEKQFYPVYRGLSACPGNRQNMEEFLISVNKKQQIEYLTEEKEIRVDDPQDIAVCTLHITKNGWGYADLQIETDGEFLYAEKERLADDDFLGNRCRLPVYIDSGLLHAGVNMGRVRLRYAYGEVCVPVTAVCRADMRTDQNRRERQRLMVLLMERYQEFRMKKINTQIWLRESGKLTERLTAMVDWDIPVRLFQAHLLITEQRINEARRILEYASKNLGGEEQQPEIWAYYLYLTTLVNDDEEYVDQVTAQVEKLYKRERGRWRIAWLLLYLSEEYSRNSARKLAFLEESFQRGATSPVLYIEALTLIHANPALLMKLGEFEKQILFYAVRKDWLSRDVMEQAVYLIQKTKESSRTVCRFLTACYERRPEDQLLREICALLIRSGKAGVEYFPWYQRGVERGLRITRLYEYYMMSVDLNFTGVLPRAVLMYFSYQSSLDDERNAFLYASVHRNRKLFPELYGSYLGSMEKFVLQQIRKQRISRDLAYLYRQVLTPEMLTPEIAEALSRLLFVHLIRTPRKDIRQVVVYQPLAEEEQAYPMTDGRAYVPLFGDHTLLLEDGEGNRYVASVPYTTEKLMLPGKLAKDIAPLVRGQIGYDVYQCINGSDFAEVTPDNEGRFRDLMASPRIAEACKPQIGIRLMNYYYNHDRTEELDAHLERMLQDRLPADARGEVLRYLVIRGMTSQAYELVCRYGPYRLQPKVVLRLCSSILQQEQPEQPEEDPQMTGILIWIFRQGKYDEAVLRYLMRFYRGMTRELRDIWKAAGTLGQDTWEFCERMLIQMLFTGAFVGENMEILKSYVKGGANPEVEAAFLAQCSYHYFVKDRVMERYAFEELYRLYCEGEAFPQVSMLAFLKYYAENRGEITDDLRPLLRKLAVEAVKDGVCLRFLLEYADLDPALSLLADRTIVEYRAHPGARAIMHYVIEREEGETGEYLTGEMKQVYGGVCFMSFTLFFGESLQYYIVEETGGGQQLTESGSVQKSDADGRGEEGKFTLINDIAVADTLQDYGTLDYLLEEYCYKEYVRDNLFHLKS